MADTHSRIKFYERLLNYRDTLILAGILVALIIVSSMLSDRFLGRMNIENLLVQSVGVGIVSFGLCAVILTSGIDLSIGMNVTLGNCIASHIFVHSLPLGVAAVILTCTAVGFINGQGITRLRLNPFIMTFGMMLILQGAALFLRPEPGGEIPIDFYYLLMSNIGPIPKPILLLLACFGISWILLNSTKIGTHIYAIGNNESVSQLSGINVDRVKVLAYAYCGLLGGIGANFYAAQTLSGDPSLGMPITLDAIAAVALGGVPLIGGRGGAVGVLIGIFIVTIISNILNLANVSTFYQYVIKGVILLVAVGATSR
jgi:ribose transport system permease protein